ncbi:MAG: T9SS type A sorting domain-containing protein [Bacteroidales bacterium]|nr:MAG: T9SS type A sorting domain-containing protein [Bacteroidales bacterium]
MKPIYKKLAFTGITILIGLTGLKTVLSQTTVNISAEQPPQLTVDAGDDATINVGEGITLGGTPAATGGSGNYIYNWSHPTYLDNSIIANPLATPPGNLTFTLTVTDENGCTESDAASITVLGGTGVKDSETGIDLNIFPNPGSGKFTIAFSNSFNEKRILITVTNLSGQKVYEEICDVKPDFQKEIDISFLSGGFYILTIEGESIYLDRQLILR